MSIIPLRQYTREIEGLVESGQVAEAIAHCRHILQIYPKHIQTYRLLGKIHLESQQYSDAVDIFQRLLTVVPDDFIAHVGMSIIREDENNLDAAIWHMERAFETQPSNSAIQEELRRLYGRRDGIEPPKIRLTRGALARMYARGNLYEQAIAELRAALSDDPQRVDLQVLLAQMYYHTKQLIESIEICSSIIKKYPYCLDANRLLAAILPETDRAGDTAVYRQRLLAIDPYFASTPVNATSTDDVPENAVTIERLNYRPGQQAAGAPEQPAWASSLGITFEQEGKEELPEWLQESETHALTPGQEAPPPTMTSLPEPSPELPIETPPKPAGEDDIPDWMRTAGWQSAPEAEEQAPISSDQDAGEISRGDIPDWLKDLAPAGVFDEELPPLDEGSEPALPWLQETEPGASDTVKNWLEEPSSTEPGQSAAETTPEVPGTNLPDWLSEEGSELPPDLQIEPTPEEEDQLPGWLTDIDKPLNEPSGVTDWLRTAELPEEPLPLEAAPEEAGTQDELPDWLHDVSAPKDETLSPTEETLPAQPDAEIPTWLQDWEQATPTPVEAAETPTSAKQPELSDEDAALSWLESLAAQQGAKEDELITKPEERLETPPDWVREEVVPENFVEEPTPVPPDEEMPDWLQDMRSEEVFPGDSFEAPAPLEEVIETTDLPEWLHEIPAPAEELPISESELPAPQEDILEAAELPEWLSEMKAAEETTSQETQASPAEPPAEWLPASEITIPDITSTGEPPEAIPDLSDQDAALAWLENLAAQHGAKEEELITKPEERLDTPPEWVLEESASEKPIEVTPAEEIPAWLQDEPAAHPLEEASETAIPGMETPALMPEDTITPDSEPSDEAALLDEIPDWLQEEPTATIAQAPAEALPSEELPAWLQDLSSEPIPETPTEAAASEELTVLPLEEPAEVVPQPPAEIEPAEEIPSWLKDLAREPLPETPPEAAVSEELPISPLEEPVTPIPPPPVEIASPEEMPAWIQQEPEIPYTEKVDLNTASLTELERLPGVGFILAQNILTYRDANGALSSIDDLGNIPGFTPTVIDGLRSLITIEPAVVVVPEPIADENEVTLTEARNSMNEGNCTAALGLYSSLVKKGYHLETIIRELENALYRYPLDVNIWQGLGDAHMRNDNLQEALDAYIKAEDLLR